MDVEIYDLRTENIHRLMSIFSIEEERQVIEMSDSTTYIEADDDPKRYVLIMQDVNKKSDFTFRMFDYLEDAENFATDEIENSLGTGSYPATMPRIAIQVCDLDSGRLATVDWEARVGTSRSMADWE